MSKPKPTAVALKMAEKFVLKDIATVARYIYKANPDISAINVSMNALETNVSLINSFQSICAPSKPDETHEEVIGPIRSHETSEPAANTTRGIVMTAGASAAAGLLPRFFPQNTI